MRSKRTSYVKGKRVLTTDDLINPSVGGIDWVTIWEGEPSGEAEELVLAENQTVRITHTMWTADDAEILGHTTIITKNISNGFHFIKTLSVYNPPGETMAEFVYNPTTKTLNFFVDNPSGYDFNIYKVEAIELENE